MNRRNLSYGGGWSGWSAAVAVGVVVVSGVGVADAATSYFALGASNTETKTATLTNTNGTPLSLVAKAGTPPLKVNTKTLVGNLNAQFVGGLPAATLQPIAYITAGTRTITVPAGVSHLYAVVVGGGGAGDANGCGGGQGASLSLVADVSRGDRIDVSVGAGGVVGGSSGTDAGGTSSIGPHGSPRWVHALGGDSGAAGGPASGGGNDWGAPGTLPVAEAAGLDGGDCNSADYSGGGPPNIAGSGGQGKVGSANPGPGIVGYALVTFEK